MATNVAHHAKAAFGTLLAGTLLATAMPATAQNRGHHGRTHDGISAGEVIAGAIIVGGLAAILSSSGRDDRYSRDPRYDRNYDGYDWNRHGGSREAIQRCVAAVERRGGRHNDIDVRRITDVDRIRNGYRIEGQVAVDRGRGYHGNGRWNDGRRYDDRGRYDERGRFSCTVRYGRVDDLRVRGI